MKLFKEKRVSIKTEDVLLLFFLVSISAFRLNPIITVASYILVLGYSFLVNKNILLTRILKWGVVFWTYYFISAFWSSDASDTIRYLSAFAYTIGIFLFLPKLITDEKKIEKLLKLIVCSIAISAIMTLLLTPLSELGSSRIGGAIDMNANSFGIRMAFGFIISLFLLCNKSIQINRLLYSLLSILFTILTLLSGSKKALLLIILGLIMVIFITSANKKKVLKVLVSLLMAAAMIFIVISNDKLYSTMGYRLERFFLTLNSENSESTTLNTVNGRVGTTDKSLIERNYYMNEAMTLFAEHPAFGYGGNNFVTYMREKKYRHVAYSHNNYTEILCTLGVVGFVIYYSYWIWAIIKLIRIKRSTNDDSVKKYSELFLSVLLLLLILDYGNVSYTLEFNMFILCIVDIFIRLNGKQRINNETQ